MTKVEIIQFWKDSSDKDFQTSHPNLKVHWDYGVLEQSVKLLRRRVIRLKWLELDNGFDRSAPQSPDSLFIEQTDDESVQPKDNPAEKRKIRLNN